MGVNQYVLNQLYRNGIIEYIPDFGPEGMGVMTGMQNPYMNMAMSGAGFQNYGMGRDSFTMSARPAVYTQNIGAQSHLGSCYYRGEITVQDYIQAVYWYRKAAEQGYDHAQDGMGDCYYGIGVDILITIDDTLPLLVVYETCAIAQGVYLPGIGNTGVGLGVRRRCSSKACVVWIVATNN